MKHLIFILILLEHLALKVPCEAFVVAYQLLVQSSFVSSRPPLCHITICCVHVCVCERERAREREEREGEKESARASEREREREKEREKERE